MEFMTLLADPVLADLADPVFSGLVLAFVAAFLAIFLPGIGSSIGMMQVAEFGTGVVSEKPELFASALILTLMPSTQTIYGLLTGFFILIQIDALGGIPNMLVPQYAGMMFVFAALPVGILGLLTSYAQGRVCIGGLSLVSKRPTALGQAIVIQAVIETIVIFGLLISMMMVIGVGNYLGEYYPNPALL